MKSSRSETLIRRGRPPKTALASPTKKEASPARSPARARRSSPVASGNKAPRSPSRRSPARKSPARNAAKPRTPRKQSPARAEPKKSPKKEPAVKLVEPTVRLSRPRRTEYSIKDLSSGLNQIETSVVDGANGINMKERVPRAAIAPQVVRRTSARLRESLSQASASSGVSESASRSLDIPLDEDSQDSDIDQSRSKSTSAARKLATPLPGFSAGQSGYRWEFGGRVGNALLLILVPVWVFSVLTLCSRSCAFVLPLFTPLTPSALFSRESAILVASQIIIQTVISIFNVLGRRVDRLDGSGKQQYFNGLFATLVTIAAVFSANFFEVLSVKVILDEYLRLAVLFYILAVLLAVGLFMKSQKLPDDQLNPYGNSGFALYDFCIGRQIFPQLGSVDVKMLLHRICNVNGLILSSLIFSQCITLPAVETLNMEKVQNYGEILKKLQYQPTLLVFSLMQLIYFLNLIINEHKITSTFSWQSEGVGYLQCVSSAIYPFYFLTISKYIADNNVVLSTKVLIVASSLYLLGFLLYSTSNNVKHSFRVNPLQSKLSHLEVMPTFLGKRLITSGPWGTVRHPNYLGDIIMHLALAIPGALALNAAVLPAVTTILVLMHRAQRDNARCSRRYGAAWQRYSAKVDVVHRSFPERKQTTPYSNWLGSGVASATSPVPVTPLLNVPVLYSWGNNILAGSTVALSDN